ncbi:MAG: NAD(P)-binding protein, partial [Gammaproteobacteria bacterium]|nr:NAD(P)-binding protein [Gammaproteobacteria bacterium]
MIRALKLRRNNVTDIIIVGGGISGMLSAWYLARAGARVR